MAWRGLHMGIWQWSPPTCKVLRKTGRLRRRAPRDPAAAKEVDTPFEKAATAEQYGNCRNQVRLYREVAATPGAPHGIV